MSALTRIRNWLHRFLFCDAKDYPHMDEPSWLDRKDGLR